MTVSTRASLPPLPVGIRMLTSAQSIALDERLPNSIVPKGTCVTCKGRKVFLWYDPDKKVNTPVEFDCPCDDQYLMYRYFLNSGVGLNYQRLGWRDFLALSEDAVKVTTDYLNNQDRYRDAGIGLVISGTKGNGKSLLAMLLIKMLLASGVKCYATTFSDMIEHFAGGWQDRAQSRWFDRTVRNAGVLYIDDLGRERNKGPNSIGDNMLESVVRSRVSSNLPTIMTTNLSQEDIALGYGGHTMSLLTECSIPVEVVGSDRRQEVNRRAIDEVVAGLTRPVVSQ